MLPEIVHAHQIKGDISSKIFTLLADNEQVEVTNERRGGEQLFLMPVCDLDFGSSKGNVDINNFELAFELKKTLILPQTEEVKESSRIMLQTNIIAS